MSRIITQSLEGNITYAFSLINQFVEVCPDELWGKKFGGWPIWQQVYHAFGAIDFFLRGPDDSPQATPFSDEIGSLAVPARETPGKPQLKAYIAGEQVKVKNYISGLDDAALAEPNPGLTQRMGAPTTHAGTLCLIASHTLYHLGSCDAALRENGLPGVF